MSANRNYAPTPDLRIVVAESLYAHEEHDPQRLNPLVERFRKETHIINPPVVASIDSNRFVILDGANRCHSFRILGFPHMLVQVVSYDNEYIELETWNHVISHWDEVAFLDHLRRFDGVEIIAGQVNSAIAHVIFRTQGIMALCSPVNTVHERNEILREVVNIYQTNATLHRTTTSEPDDVWQLYENAVAMMIFPKYKPADILAAAKYNAYLPAGVSRHIVHGRALRVNYPIEKLRDGAVRLHDKNSELKHWLQDKLENRHVRYYAEATYQFDE